jgi:hypothetical protein
MFKAVTLAAAATLAEAAALQSYYQDDGYGQYYNQRRTPTHRPRLGLDKYDQTIWDYRTEMRARRYDDDLPRHYDYRPWLNDGPWKYFNRNYDSYDFVVDRFVPNNGSGIGWGPYQLYGNDADYDYWNRGQWRGEGQERATGGYGLETVGPRVLAYRRHGNDDYLYDGVTGGDYYGPSERYNFNDAYLGDVYDTPDYGWNRGSDDYADDYGDDYGYEEEY